MLTRVLSVLARTRPGATLLLDDAPHLGVAAAAAPTWSRPGCPADRLMRECL